MAITKNELAMLQALPLELKIAKSKLRIEEWVNYMGKENVYISFSGGKDSTVLLHLVRSLYPDIPAVFSNTGLEFPELVEFVQRESVMIDAEEVKGIDFEKLAEENNCTVEKIKKLNKCESIEEIEVIEGKIKVYIPRKNLVTVRPEKSFKQVIEQEGYPVISKKTSRMIHDLQNPTEKNETSRRLYLSDYALKNGEVTDIKNNSFNLANKHRYLIDAPFKISNKCCDYLKKNPLKKYEKKSGKRPIMGTMANESKMREATYLKSGCNVFDEKKGSCTPLGFWTEQDVLAYIKMFNLDYASVYGDIVEETDLLGNVVLTTTGEKRTGCIFCMYGIHLEKGENRFQRLERTHPQLHDYCMNKLGFKEVCEFMNIPYSNNMTEIERK